MPLLDDIGGSASIPSPAAAAPTASLLSDIGGDTSTAKAASEPSAHPVTDEVERIGSNIVKQIPRNLMQGVGALADLPGTLYDMAFHPEDDEPHPMAHLVAEKLADRMEKSIPQLKPVNQGPIERSVGAGIEALPQAAFGGPEAIIPTFMSGAASQGAKEAGLGPVAQTVAGLTPFAPSAVAGATRALVRGGEEGAAQTAENLANAKNAGINISTGQATGNSAVQTAETLSSKLPGGGSVSPTRGSGLNAQAEESVGNIVKKLAPDVNQKPPTPTSAGETVKAGVSNKIDKLNEETSDAKEAMEQAVGGKELPMAAPKLEKALNKITSGTGVEEVDRLVTGAKTKQIANAVTSISDKPKVPTSYSSDGEGAHVATSPNGETHAVETATGDLKVTRSDTSPTAQGQGEGTSRLETLAHAATSQGKNLISDISVSPAESAAYEKLSRKGWTVEKNPNAEVNPATGNTISDSPKNPVYTVKAPKTQGTGQTAISTPSTEKQFTGEWSYDPKTGQSIPGTSTPQTGVGPAKEGQTAVLDTPTPHTFDSLRQLRTLIGRGTKSTRDPGQQAQLKQLYGAISEDLQDGVSKVGPQAEQAYGLFNSVAKQNASTQKILVKAITKAGGPEAVFKAAVNGSKDGASKISPIMGAMDEDGKNLFRATVLHRLGRAGGAADAPFDANLLLTNWKGMSPEAKNVVFGANSSPSTGQLRTSLDSLGKTLDLLKSQGYIKSGLTNSVQQGVSGAIGHSGVGAMIALIGERAASAMGHLVSGNPVGAAAAIGSGAGALALNPIMSRVLTNPKTAAWLAQATKVPKGALPVLLTQLGRIGTTDPDAKDLANLISQSGGATTSTQASNSPPPRPPQETGVRETVYPQINRSAGMQPLPGGGYGIPPETM